MTESVEISSVQPLDEFLYRCQLLAELFDESERWHYFTNQESWIAEEARPIYREEAKWRAYDRVATRRITKNEIAQADAIYRGKAFGEKLHIPNIDKDTIRTETLRELNELWREIVVTHQAAN